MKWIHVKAGFSGNDPDLAEELVTDIFLNLGLKGVVCEVPLPPPDDGFIHPAQPRPEQPAISGYLPDTDASLEPLDAIRKRAAELKEAGIAVTITTRQVDQESWAHAWKDFFFVTRITDRIVIKPDWRDFEASGSDLIIHIDPGMAFGTGTHPTTAMCIAMIEEWLKPDRTLLDVGTGSGILMIAGALVGASAMAGIDTDEVAVRVARENLDKNNIDPGRYDLIQGTLADYDPPGDTQFDVVVANILARVIVDIIPEIKTRVKPGGTVILSGIIQEQKKEVIDALHHSGFTVAEVREEGEWVALAAGR